MARDVINYPSISLSIDESPVSDVTVRYVEKQTFWGNKRQGTLRISVRHDLSALLTTYERTFENEWDFTHERENADQEGIANHIARYLIKVMKTLDVPFSECVKPEDREKFEKSLLLTVCTLTDNSYVDDKYRAIVTELTSATVAEELEQEEQERITKEEQRREELKQRKVAVAETVKAYEIEARYAISKRSECGDYALTREHVKAYVDNLFDPNDNLLFEPMFDRDEDGKWAEFTKETQGRGIYHRLFRTENDLDDFHITVGKKLESEAAKSNGEVKVEDYEKAIVGKFELADIIERFEARRDVRVDLLGRFKDRLEEEERLDSTYFSSTKTLLWKSIVPDAERFTFKKYGVPGFDASKAEDGAVVTREAFDKYLSRLTGVVERYFTDNKEDILVKAKEDSGNRRVGLWVVTAGDTNAPNAIGVIKERTRSKKEHQLDIDLKFNTPKGEEEPNWHNFSPKDVCPLVPLENRYGSAKAAAQQIVAGLADKALSGAKESSGLKEEKDQIRRFHPDPDGEIGYEKQSFELMRERFIDMFRRHGKDEQVEALEGLVMDQLGLEGRKDSVRE